MSAIPQNMIFPLGNSGSAAYGGFGAGAMILKDHILDNYSIPGTGVYTILVTDSTGKIYKCDGPNLFDFGGTWIIARAHLAITTYAQVNINDQTISNKFLGFQLNSIQLGNVTRAFTAFVQGTAQSLFIGEMFPGDQLGAVITSDAAILTVDGEVFIGASLLPP